MLAGWQRGTAQGCDSVHGRSEAARPGAQQLHGVAKKLVEAHTLADGDQEDTFAKGCALIRANLHINADEIESEDEWAALYGQALWLERWRNRNRAELIASLFGDGKS